MYVLDFTPVLNGGIPEGWRVTQEDNGIHEYPNSFGSGSRTFVGFTGYQGKGLYWRIGRADYGVQSAYPLTLQPGNYKLSFAMAAWKGTPKYKVSILNKSTGKAVVTSTVLTATPNADGSTSADLSSTQLHELAFDITEAGNYIIRFQNNGTGFDEFLLLECRINGKPDGMEDLLSVPASVKAIYDIHGVRHESLQKGLNIVVTTDGKVRKFMIK